MAHGSSPYSSPQVEQLRKDLAALIADGLVEYNIAEKGGSLLELVIVTSRVSLPEDADEDEHDAAYAEAVVAVLKEAVKDRVRSRKHRRLLRYVLPLRDELCGKSVKERRVAAGKNLTDGKRVVKPGTIRTYYEPRALEKLAEGLIEMEEEKRGETPDMGI